VAYYRRWRKKERTRESGGERDGWIVSSRLFVFTPVLSPLQPFLLFVSSVFLCL
jgi:hypothetical protein